MNKKDFTAEKLFERALDSYCECGHKGEAHKHSHKLLRLYRCKYHANSISCSCSAFNRDRSYDPATITEVREGGMTNWS